MYILHVVFDFYKIGTQVILACSLEIEGCYYNIKIQNHKTLNLYFTNAVLSSANALLSALELTDYESDVKTGPT